MLQINLYFHLRILTIREIKVVESWVSYLQAFRGLSSFPIELFKILIMKVAVMSVRFESNSGGRIFKFSTFW